MIGFIDGVSGKIQLDFSLVELFLSTFLGFLSALGVEAIANSIVSRNATKELERNLIEELRGIDHMIPSLDSNTVYPVAFTTPIWIGAKMSGSITNLEKKPYYVDLMIAFLTVEQANVIEKECFDYFLSGKKEQMAFLNDLRLKSRENVKNSINSVMKYFKQ